jgi:hypothetical protein
MRQLGEKIVKVVNVKNGGVYLISERKLLKEPGEWESYTEPVLEEDVDTEEDPDDNISYGELKAILTAQGIEFKGNASKKELLELLDEG